MLRRLTTLGRLWTHIGLGATFSGLLGEDGILIGIAFVVAGLTLVALFEEVIFIRKTEV